MPLDLPFPKPHEQAYSLGLHDGCYDERSVPAFTDVAFWTPGLYEAYKAGHDDGDAWRLLYWCEDCGDEMEAAEALANDCLCERCRWDLEQQYRAEDDYYGDYECDFADPGGRSALRAETHDNPRNLPCPTCGAENVLTPADRALGYQCDRCADQAERGGY